MSVSESISLPAQPTNGVLVHGPLGGDGMASPLARYEIDAELVMDASGGNWVLTVSLDPQYMSVVALMQVEQDIASDTAAFSMDIKMQAAFNTYRVAGDLLQLHSAYASRLWSPPPIVDPVAIDFRLVNTDGDTGRALATIYLFKKGAQHLVPIDRLMQCLVRPSSVN